MCSCVIVWVCVLCMGPSLCVFVCLCGYIGGMNVCEYACVCVGVYMYVSGCMYVWM